MLDVNVVSRRPREFLREARKRKVYFRPVKGKPWLLWANIGFFNAAIIICGELPVEKPYFNWLLFAPAGSGRWKAFVETLIAQREWELLGLVRQLRKKEFWAMLEKSNIDLRALVRASVVDEPDDPAIEEKEAELASTILEVLATKKSSQVSKILSVLKPEERVAGLSPQEREELLKILTEQASEGRSKSDQ